MLTMCVCECLILFGLPPSQRRHPGLVIENMSPNARQIKLIYRKIKKENVENKEKI